MRTVLSFLFYFSGLITVAQDCKVSAGTKTLYKPGQVMYAKVPAGYKPVFINHVGRHGARHLTKDLNNTLVYKLLVDADSLHALTSEGLKLKKMVLLLRDIEAPGLKSISQRGKSELQAIAERMTANNKPVFNQSTFYINIDVTKEIRTSQSADAFLRGLHDDRHTTGLNKKINDTTLRFYDLSPAYLNFEEHGNWHQAMSGIASSTKTKKANFEKFAGNFFRDDRSLSVAENEAFCRDVYGFAVIIPSITHEIIRSGHAPGDLDFSSFFSCEQLTVMSMLDEAEDFLLKGPGLDSMGVQVAIAVPLLVDFINSSNNIIKKGSNALQLRFAHAETIAPFASLMQLVPASKSVSNIADFKECWRADKIIPLSANIQWIFYKKKNAASYLVKFLLNEKEVAIKGLSTKSFPYYDWGHVRKFYIDLLQKLHVAITDNMYNYLTGL